MPALTLDAEICRLANTVHGSQIEHQMPNRMQLNRYKAQIMGCARRTGGSQWQNVM